MGRPRFYLGNYRQRTGRPLGSGKETMPLSREERARRNETSFDEDPQALELLRGNPDGLTLQEIAEYLGLTRERVRQIEDAAIKKLMGNQAFSRSVRRQRVFHAFLGTS